MLTPAFKSEAKFNCERWMVDFNSARRSISPFRLCFRLRFKWRGPLQCIWPLSSSFGAFWRAARECGALQSIHFDGGFKCALEIWIKFKALIWIQPVCASNFNMLSKPDESGGGVFQITYFQEYTLMQHTYCAVRWSRQCRVVPNSALPFYTDRKVTTTNASFCILQIHLIDNLTTLLWLKNVLL